MSKKQITGLQLCLSITLGLGLIFCFYIGDSEGAGALILVCLPVIALLQAEKNEIRERKDV